jgi:hypothetical protein
MLLEGCMIWWRGHCSVGCRQSKSAYLWLRWWHCGHCGPLPSNSDNLIYFFFSFGCSLCIITRTHFEETIEIFWSLRILWCTAMSFCYFCRPFSLLLPPSSTMSPAIIMEMFSKRTKTLQKYRFCNCHCLWRCRVSIAFSWWRYGFIDAGIDSYIVIAIRQYCN